MRHPIYLLRLLSLFVCSLMLASVVDARQPNVVLILADDLGYGDVTPLNPESTIATPAFERLAAEGMTFTDAHTPSAVCTPTRYGLLTGRYCWRSRLKRGVLDGYGAKLIEDKHSTIASVLKSGGYETSVVGKWHLGLGQPGRSGRPSEMKAMNLKNRLSHFPGSVGFDRSLVIPASLDFPPYVYFRNGLAIQTQTVDHAAVGFPGFTRAGPRAIDFDLRGCLDRLTDEAVEVIKTMPGNENPTFLYFPLTAPHKPVLPSEAFAGTTKLGPYGDFIRQVDAVIGRVITTLEQQNLLDETLLIVTSDNGSFMHRLSSKEPDHTDDDTIQAFRASSHRSNGPWRGTKADIWEAGHRVPFFVRLPHAKHSGTQVDRVVGLVDVMATLSDYLGIDQAENTGDAEDSGDAKDAGGAKNPGPDSVSFASLLSDPGDQFDRPPLICHSAAGMFAVRDGKWKLIAGNGSGGREAPKGKPFAEPWTLVNLESDPEEKINVAKQHPDVFRRLKEDLIEIIGEDGPRGWKKD